MVYNNNTPLGNQTIASTTDSIRNNFAFLDDAIGQEHNFDVNDATATYHLQASMPNQATSPAIPSGCDGVYFTNSAAPFFYDGSFNWQLNEWNRVLYGTFSSTGSFTNIVGIPQNRLGVIVLCNTSNGVVQTGWFCTSTTNCFGYSNRIKINGSADDYPVELNNNNNALFLQGKTGAGGSNITYNYRVSYGPISI